IEMSSPSSCRPRLLSWRRLPQSVAHDGETHRQPIPCRPCSSTSGMDAMRRASVIPPSSSITVTWLMSSVPIAIEPPAELLGIGVPESDRGPSAGHCGSAVAARQVNQRQIVVYPPLCCPARGVAKGQLQVGDCLGVSPLPIVDDPAIKGGVRELRIEAQGPVV